MLFLFPPGLLPAMWRGKWVRPQEREGKAKYSSPEKSVGIVRSKEPASRAGTDFPHQQGSAVSPSRECVIRACWCPQLRLASLGTERLLRPGLSVVARLHL